MASPQAVCLMMVMGLTASFFLGSVQAQGNANVGCKTASEWAKRSIYFLLTDRFAKTPGENNANCGDLDNNYCGGTFKGLESKLDYIAGMGFDAIWITPIQENVDRGYHGYWAKNWFAVNRRFGTEDDFKQLVSVAQAKGIWVMLDLALNHMGNAPIKDLWPFDRDEHYHTTCNTKDCEQEDPKNMCGIFPSCYDLIDSCNQRCGLNVENCRLAGLPDLDQDKDYVKQQTEFLISKVTTEYKVNGLRLDAIKHVPKWYLKNHVTDKTDCFTLGEALISNRNGRCLLSSYQKEGAADGLLNFIMQNVLVGVFRGTEPVSTIPDMYRKLNKEREGFSNPAVNGIFLDNHDYVANGCRWLGLSNDLKRFNNALVYVLTGTGIPVLYYGTEQGYQGVGRDNDGRCREPLWTSGFNEGNAIYRMVATLNRIRKTCSIWAYEEVSLSESNELYAFRRGDLYVFLTNRVNQDIRTTVSAGLLPANTRLCNVFDPAGSQGDCASVFVGQDGNRYFSTTINSDPKIFVPVNHGPSTCGASPIRSAAAPRPRPVEKGSDKPKSGPEPEEEREPESDEPEAEPKSDKSEL